MHMQVYDPSYRSAQALDSSQLLTNFSLAEHDILPAISKFACPDAAAMTAKLDKLNVYSAGDFFKAHIDTPCSVNHIGSLVVCLPHAHSGGSLVVQHHGSKVKYDWSSEDPGCEVQWAFFYSDVQHQISEVKGGHRVTLTYNLFAQAQDAQPLKSIEFTASALGKLSRTPSTAPPSCQMVASSALPCSTCTLTLARASVT